MIRVPRDFFANLSPKQYKEQLKLLPKLKDEKTQLYVMIGFTLAALIIFGIFAINPTLSTIVELKRQLADLQFVSEKLIIKTQNLSTLQQKYQSLSGNLPLIMGALPKNPEIPKFAAEINRMISNSNLKVRSLRTGGVEITPDKILKDRKESSFVFSLEAEGSYEDMLDFVSKVTKMDRLVSVELVSMVKDDKNNSLIFNLRGREYFKS